PEYVVAPVEHGEEYRRALERRELGDVIGPVHAVRAREDGRFLLEDRVPDRSGQRQDEPQLLVHEVPTSCRPRAACTLRATPAQVHEDLTRGVDLGKVSIIGPVRRPAGGVWTSWTGCAGRSRTSACRGRSPSRR